MAIRGPAAASSPLVDESSTRVCEDAAVGFFQAGADGSLTFVSPQWRELTGIDAGGTLSWFDAADPADAARLREAWESALAHGTPLDETYRLTRGGATLVLRTAVVPVAGASGETYFLGASFDVTRFEQLSSVGDVIPQLLWIAAADGTIEYFNKPWLDYTGIDPAALRANRLPNVVHPDEVDLVWQHWNTALSTGQPYEIEYRLRDHRTGTYRWFIGRAAPYRNANGEILRWVGTATDVDAQKRANDNLRFVLDASSALNANLDVDGVCHTLADLAIRRVADWCFIILKNDAGSYETHAIAHRDPERVRMLERYRDRYPVRQGSALDRAIRRNTPILIASIAEHELAAAAEDAEHFNLLRSLGMRAAMLVPLSTADGVVYGGMTLASSESARTYSAADLEVAELVAHHAAAAMHTADAFAQERRRTQRLRFIAEAGELLVRSTDLQRTLDDLVSFIVRDMADAAFVLLAEERDALRTIAGAHADPEKADVVQPLVGERALRTDAEEQALRRLAQHRTVLNKNVPPGAIADAVWEYLAPQVQQLDVRSAITVPLFSRGETFGALIVFCCTPGRTYAQDDADIFSDLGRRVSLAIEQIRTLERERRIAEALQQALLPQPGMLPLVSGLHFAAHYRPSASDAHVGGDWYDALALPDGSILVSCGDVTGRGLAAAGLMGKLRQAVGMAALYERDPARILDAVDFQMRSRRSPSLATAFVGIIDPSHTTIQYASAGHPPPLLRRNGEVTELRSAGLPIGLRDADREEAQHASLEHAELLVLYTDGLTEATRDLAFDEARLASLTASEAILFVHNPAEFLCDAILPPQAHDDTAVLAIGFGRRPSWAFDAENARAAHEARTEFIAYLRERRPEDADFAAAELVFGELVGNVVRHAPGPIEIQVDCTGARATLHVLDRGHGFVRDPSLPPDMLSESGRGLYIVSRLTQSLRIERIAGYGNHVAAELRL